MSGDRSYHKNDFVSGGDMLAVTPINSPWRMKNVFIVVFFGKTGSGKTTTINSLFKLNWPTDNAVACTRACQAVLVTGYSQSANDRLVLIDTPGVGEDQMADRKYFREYKRCVSRANHIIWLFQADTRVYRPDQIMLKKLLPHFRSSNLLTIGLNHIDRIGPGNWNYRKGQPSKSQSRNISNKLVDVHGRFSKIVPFEAGQIVPYSARWGFGLNQLRDRIFKQGATHAI